MAIPRATRVPDRSAAAAAPLILQFDNGASLRDGSPELLDKWLDRVETLDATYAEETVKKQGQWGPKLYNTLRGETYVAAKAANIAKSDLAATGGVAKLTDVIKGALRGMEPTGIGETVDMHFGAGSRKSGASINAWLTARSETRQKTRRRN